jgi:hypothetical protein
MFPWRPEGVEVEEKTHGRLISWSATRYTASCQGHPVGSMSAWAFLTTTVNFSWLVLNSRVRDFWSSDRQVELR